MLDIAWSELALIGAVALIVIGPKDLPKALRTMGYWVRKARLLAGEFQRHVDDMVREAELDDVKKQVDQLGRTDLKREIENTIDPTGDINKALRIDEPPPSLASIDEAKPVTEPVPVPEVSPTTASTPGEQGTKP